MKRIFTHLQAGERSLTVAPLLEGERVLELPVLPQRDSHLGRVYVAVVSDIREGIRAAFLNLPGGEKAYLALSEVPHLVPADGRDLGQTPLEGPLRCGDCVIVQVHREGMKGKLPSARARVQLAGRYFVLLAGSSRIGVSKKLTQAEREAVQRTFEEAAALSGLSLPLPYGLTLRTNASGATAQELSRELSYLDGQYHHIYGEGRCRTPGTLLYDPPSPAVRVLMDERRGEVEKILTDDEQLYEEMKAYLSLMDEEEEKKLSLYQDSYPLGALYNLGQALHRALSKTVWLKSGGFLVIEQTEAFCCVDVNTGKFVGKKDKEEAFLALNKEAARETVRQIRLRNLSGIILVDFINMAPKENQEALLEELRTLTKGDPLGLEVVDMTPLGIVEMIRRKERPSLLEQVGMRNAVAAEEEE